MKSICIVLLIDKLYRQKVGMHDNIGRIHFIGNIQYSHNHPINYFSLVHYQSNSFLVIFCHLWNRKASRLCLLLSFTVSVIFVPGLVIFKKKWGSVIYWCCSWGNNTPVKPRRISLFKLKELPNYYVFYGCSQWNINQIIFFIEDNNPAHLHLLLICLNE